MSDNLVLTNYMTINKSKDYAISIIRLVSIVLIVMCHFFQYYNNFLAWHFNIGVQFFLIISGYLYGLRSEYTVQKVWDGIKKILFDCYIFLFLMIVVSLIFHHRTDIGLESIWNFLILRQWPPGCAHLWYIPLILFCYMISPFISLFVNNIKKFNRIKQILLKICFLFVATLIIFRFFTNFNSAWVVAYMGAFLFADEIKENRKSFIKFVLPLLIITSIAQLSNYIKSEVVQGVLNRIFFYRRADTVRVLTAFTLFSVLYYGLSFIKFKDDIKILNITDKYSYDLYLAHQPVILGSFSLLGLTCFKFLNITITIFAVCAATILLIVVCFIIKRLFHRNQKVEKNIL